MGRSIWAIIVKDWKLEWKNKENFFVTFFFSFTLLLFFYFSFSAEGYISAALSVGIFWSSFFLSGMIALQKTFEMERENEAFSAILLSPIPRGGVYLGKLISSYSFLIFLQLFLIPLFGVMIYEPTFSLLGPLFLVVIAIAFGFCALGSLLLTILSHLRFQNLLFPLLFFPLLTPLFLSGICITLSIFEGETTFHALNWWKILIGFDLVFFLLSFFSYEFLLEH